MVVGGRVVTIVVELVVLVVLVVLLGKPDDEDADDVPLAGTRHPARCAEQKAWLALGAVRHWFSWLSQYELQAALCAEQNAWLAPGAVRQEFSCCWQADVGEEAEEVVEVLGCYFPVVYKPPPSMPGEAVVTRPALASAVERALAAAPALAPHAIPLLLEKLASSLRWSTV